MKSRIAIACPALVALAIAASACTGPVDEGENVVVEPPTTTMEPQQRRDPMRAEELIACSNSCYYDVYCSCGAACHPGGTQADWSYQCGEGCLGAYNTCMTFCR